MVDSQEFKDKIRSLLNQEYQVEFLGKNFDNIVHLLSTTKAEKIYYWIQEVINKTIQPIVTGSKATYKDWSISDILTFRYAFSIENTEYRILFVKVKNSVYIEFHLGDHNYYDKVRKNLQLKNN